MKRETVGFIHEEGLTLVEVMVAMLIFSIVVSLIFRFMDFGVTTFSYGSDMVDENSDLRLTALKITDELRFAFDVEVSDTVPSGDQKQYLYCDTVNQVMMYNDDGTSHLFSGEGDMVSAAFQIKEKTIDEVDGTGTPTGSVISIGYVLVFELQGNNNTLTSEVLLNNVPGDSVTSTLDTPSIYVGFNHDLP